jgi:tRNA threonylcarbamoyladenosine biosynthesis protein TsaB
MKPPLLLALDTSTATASLALFDGQQVLSETTWLAGREHSTRLMVEVRIALERIDRGVVDLTGLVVARGPGSFTGVRVALSVAKGLAGGLDIPAWGVGSLEVLAFAAGPVTQPVRVVLRGGRGRFATARFVDAAPTEAPRLATLDQLVGLVDEPTVLIGELLPEERLRLAEHTYVRLSPLAASARRAGFLAELGWRLAERGEAGDARTLDAVYIT